MSVRELRRHIGKYTTFNEHDVFEGLGNALSGATVENTQPSPMGIPLTDSTTSSAMTDDEDTQPSLTETPLVDSTTSSAMTGIEDTQPSPMETQLMNDPIPSLSMYKPEDEDRGTPLVNDTTVPSAEPEARIEKDLPANQGASPARLEDPVALSATLVDTLAGPPTVANSMVSEGQEYPKWVKVHSSQKAAAVESVSYKPGEPWWQHNHSSKWHKRAWHLLEEEWQDLGHYFWVHLIQRLPRANDLGQREEGYQPKESLPRVLEDSLVPDSWRNPWGEAPVSMDVPETSAAPIPLIEPTITTVISTSMGWDQNMGTVYVLTMTTSIKITNLEAPTMVVGHQGATVEELAKEDLAEGCPWLL